MSLPPPPCQLCNAVCCKSNEKISVEVKQGELERFPEAIKINTHGYDVWGLPTVNGRCVHLTEDDSCGIYERRPKLCQEFNCAYGYYNNPTERPPHTAFLRDHPEVVPLLELTATEWCEGRRDSYRKAKERT